MSAPSNMTCERCNELITELVCGELDAASESAVRAHAEQCPDCAPVLARYARVLSVAESIPLEEPSAAVQQRIMQAAREAVSRRAGSAVAIDSGSPATGFKAWLEKLSTWAMSPQVAMASVLLLVVGIGLYALPLGTDSGAPTSLELAQEPQAEGGKAAPAAAAASAPVAAPQPMVAPAATKSAPDDHSIDDLLNSATSRENAAPLEEKRAARARALPAAEPYDAKADVAPLAKNKSKPSAKKEASDEFDGLGSLGGVRSAAGGSGRGGGKGASLDSFSNAEGQAYDKNAGAAAPAQQGQFAPPPPAPVVPSYPGEKAVDQGYRREQPKAEPEADYETQPSTAAAAPPPSPSKPSAKDSGEQQKLQQKNSQNQLNEGIKAAQAQDYARAIELLTPLASSQPSARLWLARSLRARGQCERALAYYAPLASASNASNAVLQETADCYERVGQNAQAGTLRARAQPQQQRAPLAAPPKAADHALSQ